MPAWISLGRALAFAAVVETLQCDEQRPRFRDVLRIDQAEADAGGNRADARLLGEPVLGALGKIAGAIEGSTHRAG